MNTPGEGRTVLVVSPFPPPVGGMSIQATVICRILAECNYNVIAVRTNESIPKSLGYISKIKGVRTLLTVGLFLKNLHKLLPKADAVYFLTGFLNFFLWVTYPAILLIKFHKKRLILSAHGGGANDFFQIFQRFVRPGIRQVDLITAPSGFLQDVFVRYFGIKPVIVPNVIDLKRFKFRERAPLDPKFLVTRSLEGMYNVKCVIDAFEIIYNRYPDSRLGVVGDGSQKGCLKALVKEKRLTDRVTFYGRVEHETINEIYEKYDIYLNASNVDNLPGVILEAFASGLPVVSTDAGGIPYLVRHGVTGMLVEKNNPRQLAKSAMFLLNHPDKAFKMAQTARQICGHYSEYNVRQILTELL